MKKNLLASALLAAALITGLTACGDDTVTPPAAVQPSASATVTPTPAAPTAAPETPVAEPVAEPAATPSAVPAPAQSDALALLATLPVKGRAPKTGYSRDQFGQAWKDVEHNGCGTRDDILQRDLTGETLEGRCKVLSGTLNDEYTGKTINFVRGQGTSMAVQIDHRVALSNAWQTGAQQLSFDEREHLANDPINLIAVDGPTNGAKSDGDAATWLPPVKSYRCEYVAKQVAVKVKYRLWVTQPEHDTIASILSNCPTGGSTVEVVAPAVEQPTPVEPPVTAPDGTVFYQNCTAVRAAGAAPIHDGDPGYSRKLDRDGDGTGCE